MNLLPPLEVSLLPNSVDSISNFYPVLIDSIFNKKNLTFCSVGLNLVKWRIQFKVSMDLVSSFQYSHMLVQFLRLFTF